MLRTVLLVILAAVFCLSSAKPELAYVYYIKENSPTGYLVGNVISDAFSTEALASGAITGVKILKKKFPDVEYFRIEPDTGKLFTRKRIDRERACPNGKEYSMLNRQDEMSCQIMLQIFAESIQKQIRVGVVIEDENDNTPTWNKKELRVNFRDGDEAGTKKELPLAIDPDVGRNGQITYDLINDPPVDQRFTLIKHDGLYLQSLRPIDREERGFYKLTLIAKDKGNVPLTASIPIKITVEDINDNTPTFTKQEFRRNEPIPETTLAGQIVLWLTATDNDTDMNGRFHFDISRMDKNSKAAHYFRVNQNGSIVVRSPLDFDRGENKFQFKVTVEDEALRPYTRSSEATVYLTLRDENDEKPEISIQYPNTDNGQAIVYENQITNLLVAFVTVTDLDYDKTDQVECGVSNKNFSLNLLKSEPNEYELKTATQFDRETTSFQHLTIFCHDKMGHKTNMNITLKVSDINDNAPVFNRSVFRLYLAENEPPGTQLRGRVYAYDIDDGINQQIEYRIAPAYARNFSINSHNGQMTSNVTFNRENAETYTVYVLAVDKGTPRHTTTGTVLVMITDVNDNAPIFSKSNYEFHVSEGQPRLTRVGKVHAEDADTDHRSKVTYSINHADSHPFSINRETGLITTRYTLNRESQTRYEFPVYARDQGQGKAHTSTATVTVIIEDINDNSPVFVHPNATFNSYHIDAHKTLGYTIAYILAKDADDKDNSQVSYSIKSGNTLGLFSLDTRSGLLFLASPLPADGKPFYLLALEACDNGSPKRCTTYRNLRIIVKGKPALQPPNSGGYETLRASGNEPVLICLSVIFVILVLATVVLICLIRRKAYWLGAQRNRKQNARTPPPLGKPPTPCSLDCDMSVKDNKSNDVILEDEALLRLKSANSMTMDSRKHRKRNNTEDFPPEYQTLDGLCLASGPPPGTMRYTSCDPTGSMMHTYYEISPGRMPPIDHRGATSSPSDQPGGFPMPRENFLMEPGAVGGQIDGSMTCPISRKLQQGHHPIGTSTPGTATTGGYQGSDKNQYTSKYTFNAYSEASFV